MFVQGEQNVSLSYQAPLHVCLIRRRSEIQFDLSWSLPEKFIATLIILPSQVDHALTTSYFFMYSFGKLFLSELNAAIKRRVQNKLLKTFIIFKVLHQHVSCVIKVTFLRVVLRSYKHSDLH